jgi:hypothetical protein
MTSKRKAVVIASTLMELLVYPAIFYLWRARRLRTAAQS